MTLRELVDAICKQEKWEKAADAFRQAGQVLKRNELFLLAFDASKASRNCIAIPFGETFLEAHLGTALLALRSRAPILRISNRVMPSGQSRTTIAPPLQIPPACEPRSDSASLLTSWVRELETETTGHPEQWCLWGYVALGAKSEEATHSGHSEPRGSSPSGSP